MSVVDELPTEVQFVNWSRYQHTNATQWVKLHYGVLYDGRVGRTDLARSMMLTGLAIAGMCGGKISVAAWVREHTSALRPQNVSVTSPSRLSDVSITSSVRPRYVSGSYYLRLHSQIKLWIDNGLLIAVPPLDREINSLITTRERDTARAAREPSLNGNGLAKHEKQSEAPREPAVTPPAVPQLAVAVRRGNPAVRQVPAIETVVRATDARGKRDTYAVAVAGYVFSYWASRLGHTTARLDQQRERRLLARLTECEGNPNDLLYAVDGALQDPWTMGRDQRSVRRFDGIETIFRERGKVEALAALVPAWIAGVPHPRLAEIPALEGAH
jgi:hypothetical protein